MLTGQLYAGDYVLVWGELDEDGYLEAELLDGRRGLVSSTKCSLTTLYCIQSTVAGPQ